VHPAIAEHKSEIAKLCRDYGVLRLEAFGSGARGTDFDPARSDADFLVEFAPKPELPAFRQYFGFADALKDLLGRPVDLVEEGAIKNPYLRAEINQDRELVYAA
jgi:predicted nucleotidyltransferase